MYLCIRDRLEPLVSMRAFDGLDGFDDFDGFAGVDNFDVFGVMRNCFLPDARGRAS